MKQEPFNMFSFGIARAGLGASLALCASVCLTAAFPSFAESISVTPVLDSDGLEAQFDLTLDVSETRFLCVAWGETDAGTDWSAWANRKIIGEVDSATTAWTASVPEGWGAETRALRFFLVEKKSPPYDSRVEWIESTGKEWINTGYIGAYTDVYDLHFAWTTGGFPMASFAGSAASENKRYSVLDLYGGKIGIALNSQYSSGHDSTRDSRRNIAAGEEIYTRTIMKQSDETAHVSSTSFDDMGKTTSIKATAAVANTTAPLYIFARNCGNTSTDITKTGTVDGHTVMRLWSCYVTHNGTPVRNFIPCVKDGEAMLYDKVNNRLHRNVSGAGAFIAGPVVEESLLGTMAAASASVVPSRPVALITIASSTASEVSFAATLAQSASAVSAAFAYGNSPDTLGAAAEVSANWTQGGSVSFSATGLSAGGRKYGVLELSRNGAVVRTYGLWFVAAGAEGRAVATGAEKAGGVVEAVVSKASAAATNVLFVAYGAVPGGDAPESWAHCERVCLVDGEARTVDVAVPGWGDTTAAMRFFLKEYVPYPFDAQVKWIASTGAEWINTGYVSRTNDFYEVSFRSEYTAAGHFIVGAYGSAGMDVGGGTRATVMQAAKVASASEGYGFLYGFAYNGSYKGLDKMELGADLTLQAEFAAGTQSLKHGYMGGTIATYGTATYAGDFNCDSPLYVFARNTGNTSTDIAATATKVDNKAAARLYSFSIVHNGTLVRDFVPVVKNGAGGLYDRVNGRCHWNVSGAGAIECGPQVPESGGEPGAVAARSAVYLMQEVSGTATLRGAYATTADFTMALGSAGAAATANVVFEYGTTAEYGTGVAVDAAMAPGESMAFTVGGLSANTTYFWRVTANGDEIASGTFTTQGAYRTVALREVVESEGGETLCCKIDFGAAVQNETCRLVFAYGTAEGGVELSSWENCVVVGTVVPGDTSFEHTLPAGLVEGAFKYRFYLVSDGDSLPGVTGVPYIESTGSEWIDTGYIGAFDDEYEISFRSLNPNKEWFMLGSYGPTLDGRYTVVQSSVGNFACYFNKSGDTSGGILATVGIDYRLRASFAYGAQSVYVSKDGGEFALAGKTSVAANPANTMAPLYLFGRNCANSSVDNVTKARLYSCRITHNGTVVRDFAPCVRDGEAGLYDRVSGRFHGNMSGNGAFIAGDGGETPATVYSYTVSTNGVGATVDHASKAGAITTISALGCRISASASVASLGLGTTYPHFEWWVEGGSVTNAIPFAAIPANDTAETHEYSTTFDAVDAWNRTVCCRFAVSNVYANATGGTCAWHDSSAQRSVAVVDDATYTWQTVDGDWNGDWTDPAHWASDHGDFCVGHPTATSNAVVPEGADATIALPDGTNELKVLNINAKSMSVAFRNAFGNAALKPATLTYGDATGAQWGGQLVALDGVTLIKSSPAYVLSVPNGAVFALRGPAAFNSTKLDMINPENTGYTGRVEIGAGARWPETGEISLLRLGGEGVMHVEGSLNVAEFKIGQFGSWGGGTLEIAGREASVNVSKMLRCWNGAEYTTPSHVSFRIPAEGWSSAPLKGGASADPLAGSAADSANVAAKLKLEVPAGIAAIAARRGHRRPLRVPLVDWPTGITVDRCELVAGEPERVRLAWTYGADGSEESDGKPPTGLVAYVTGVGGTCIMAR